MEYDVLDAINSVQYLRENSDNTSLDLLQDTCATLTRLDRTINETRRTAISVIPEFSRTVYRLKEYCSGTGIWLNFYRRIVILSESQIYRVLNEARQLLVDMVNGHVSPTDYSNDAGWFFRLSSTIVNTVRDNSSVTIMSSSYSDLSLPVAKTYFIPRPTGRYRYLSNEKILLKSLDHLSTILEDWLDIPNTFLWPARAYFAEQILTHLGPGFLLIPAVWEVYSGIPTYLFDGPRPASRITLFRFTVGLMSQFADVIETTAKTGAMVEQITLVADLQEAYHGLVQDSLLGIDPHYPPVIVQTLAHSHTTALLSIGPAGPIAPPATDIRPSQRISPVLSLLQDTLLVLKHMYPPSDVDVPSYAQSLYTLEQRAMLKRPDFMIPLREFAPSRRRVNGLEFPSKLIRSDFAKTNAGLFSVFVFRCMSFNTEAFLRIPYHLLVVEFHSIEEWRTYVAALKQYFPSEPDHFFCSKTSIGTRPIPNRTLDAIPVIWNTICDSNWSSLSDSMSFSQALTWLRKLKHRTSNSLPGAGDLVLFLVVGDLCSMGVVRPPTLDEMGGIIEYNQSGSLHGLIGLGYISEDDQNDTKLVIRAFKSFMADVDMCLTTTEQQAIGWSCVTGEHTLCKMKRILAARGFGNT